MDEIDPNMLWGVFSTVLATTLFLIGQYSGRKIKQEHLKQDVKARNIQREIDGVIQKGEWFLDGEEIKFKEFVSVKISVTGEVIPRKTAV